MRGGACGRAAVAAVAAAVAAAEAVREDMDMDMADPEVTAGMGMVDTEVTADTAVDTVDTVDTAVDTAVDMVDMVDTVDLAVGEAARAFPTSDQQFEFLMKLPLPYRYQWLSINDIQEERVYKDIFNKTVVNIDKWISRAWAISRSISSWVIGLDSDRDSWIALASA
ncbi:hypothetical protein FJT64_023395 [Amphibalanus amphitrite]|uniref:Uncharacterized protein n=1 Tax=Amphibalanus amphitrite TaxID=1232801 RepID=A0A6A4WM65_AMPAM|nr:hypothetical protein FJT64_023395 [Amphibalanus amphitrite]